MSNQATRDSGSSNAMVRNVDRIAFGVRCHPPPSARHRRPPEFHCDTHFFSDTRVSTAVVSARDTQRSVSPRDAGRSVSSRPRIIPEALCDALTLHYMPHTIRCVGRQRAHEGWTIRYVGRPEVWECGEPSGRSGVYLSFPSTILLSAEQAASVSGCANIVSPR